MKARASLLAALSFAPGCQQNPEASEQQTAIDPCYQLTSNLEYTRCWQDVARQTQSEVDATYARARQAANASDKRETPLETGESEMLLGHSLQDSQAEWAEFTNRQCLFEGKIARGGTGTRALVAKCQYRLNDQRIEELESTIRLIEGNS